MQTAILTFIIPVIAMIFTLAFFALWWNDRKNWPVLAFAICFFMLALGIAINIWIIEKADGAGIVAYHIVSMTGLLALMWGVAKRADVKAPIALCAASAVFVSALLWLSVSVGQPDAMRLAQNTNAAMIAALIAACLWYGTKRNPADHFLVWVLVAFAAFGFLRPVLTILASAVPGEDGVGIAILSAVHILVIATLLTLIALCLIASIVFGTMKSERELATTDPLTGLPNRAAFEGTVKDILDEAVRERVPISLIVGDIDNFKLVNDTWGHSAGDRVIATFGRLVAEKVRPKDVGGRVGGEEFCILVWNCSEQGAVSLANRLRLAFSSALVPGFPSHTAFTASFGVAQWQMGESYAQTFQRADEALYAAKRGGRDRVKVVSGASGGSSAKDDADHVQNKAPNGEVVSLAKVRSGTSSA